MKQKVFLSLALCGALFLGVRAEASPLHILSFQVNVLGVFQNANGSSYSGQLAWTPILDIGAFGIRGELGAGLLNNSVGSEFTVFNYEGFLRFSVIPMVLGLEVGGGMETWSNNGGSNPIASADLFIKVASFIDRIFLGYSRYFLPNTTTNEVQLGLGLIF